MAGKSNEGEKEEEEEKALVYELRENIEPAIFHLCAERPEDVKKASDWLKNVIKTHLNETTIEDPLIKELEGKEGYTLAELQRKLEVSINVDIPKSAITVRGLTSHVLDASTQIQDMIRKVQEQKAREREADLCSQVVQWEYFDGTNFIPFDKMINLDLEKARKDARQSLNIDILGVKYTVVAERKTEIDGHGNKLQLKRSQKNVFQPVKAVYNFMAGKSNEGEKEEEEEKALVYELRENIEPAIFHLCAERPEDVKKASDWLKNVIKTYLNETPIKDPLIKELERKEGYTLAELQRKLEVDIPKSAITVRGLTSHVHDASTQIQDMIRKVQEQKDLEWEADLCSQVVQWEYFDGTNFIPFDKMINLDLEKARKDARQSLNIDILGVKYTVVAERKTALDGSGNKLQLKRSQKNVMARVPDYWDPMDGAQVKVVPVAAGTKEYNEVTGLFAQTCLMKIVKIERIQNKSLYENYQIKKNSMDAKNCPRTINERRLFHGTDADTTKKINHSGFNRSYTQNQKLGKGTYFAVDANYSALDDFSKPDSNGNQYMYLARVLTGIFCKGNEDMIVPSPKDPANPADLCDSAADHETNPSVFAIFNDVSAYPEYLITFRK